MYVQQVKAPLGIRILAVLVFFVVMGCAILFLGVLIAGIVIFGAGVMIWMSWKRRQFLKGMKDQGENHGGACISTRLPWDE